MDTPQDAQHKFYGAELNQKLAEIQTKLKAHKSQRNNFGNYNYRTAEDVLEAIKPFLLELNVSVTIKEKYLGDAVIKSTAILSDGIQKIKATAIVMVDVNQKGMAMPQKYGAASSYGKKYALGNLFLIDESKDADATNQHKLQLVKNTPTYEKVVKAIKNGWSVADVEAKFELSDEMKSELEQLKPIK